MDRREVQTSPYRLTVVQLGDRVRQLSIRVLKTLKVEVEVAGDTSLAPQSADGRTESVLAPHNGQGGQFITPKRKYRGSRAPNFPK